MLGYNSAVFDAAEIENLAGQFRTLLESAVADPGQEIAAAAGPSGEERDLLLDDFNASFELSHD
jgi:hypothetical protein